MPGFVIRPGAASDIAIAQSSLNELARDVDRAESMRAVKQLQRTYAQYSQYGLWNEMAQLFAEDATYTFDKESVKGRTAIAAYIAAHEGGGQQGLRPGAVHTQIIDHPVVNLSVDGESASGRWYGFFLLCDSQGNASLQGGVFENRYVREGGRWKIGAYHFFPQYAGPYETGWTNWKGQDLGILAYHFTPDEAGIPIPAARRRRAHDQGDTCPTRGPHCGNERREPGAQPAGRLRLLR